MPNSKRIHKTCDYISGLPRGMAGAQKKLAFGRINVGLPRQHEYCAKTAPIVLSTLRPDGTRTKCSKLDDNVSIHPFESCYKSYRNRYEASALGIRTVLERLNVARNRMFTEARTPA